ncbi:ATP-dependent Clp protease proteolytic subunit [Mesorhizobium yinganensis]|uniref:ATP-dependent Clp protease proteolytic subunit n=1 Tax=Mesorhizobium yinganensis TaxID=3157707 RepID=UPI0032B7FDA3
MVRNRREPPEGIAEVRIIGEVDWTMATSVLDGLDAVRNAKELRVVIDTRGGDYHAAMRVYRGIRWHQAETKTALIGSKCQSAGVVVALACDRRVMRADSSFFMHLVSDIPGEADRWTVRRHMQASRALQALDSEMLNMFADRTGAALDVILAEALKEQPSEPDWLMRHGFVHEVVA